jgi:hypothetical protein
MVDFSDYAAGLFFFEDFGVMDIIKSWPLS